MFKGKFVVILMLLWSLISVAQCDNEMKNSISVNCLTKLLGRRLSDKELKHFSELYHLQKIRGKSIFFCSSRLGFRFLAHNYPPEKFMCLQIRLNDKYLNSQIKHVFTGVLPFNLKRDCSIDEVMNKLNIKKKAEYGNSIEYSPKDSKLKYTFSFDENNKIASISIWFME